MPSALPRFVIRASQERIDAWKVAPSGESTNEWAVRVLDEAAGSRTAVRPKPKRSASRAECPRVRHHRPGAFCKECGEVVS